MDFQNDQSKSLMRLSILEEKMAQITGPMGVQSICMHLPRFLDFEKVKKCFSNLSDPVDDFWRPRDRLELVGKRSSLEIPYLK